MIDKDKFEFLHEFGENIVGRNFDLIKKNLISLGYIVNCFETASEAANYINSQIDNQTVGFAGSMTLEKMGLFESLSTHNQVFWHHRIPEGKTSKEVRLEANAASIFYGHEKVYFVIGENKIEKDYDSALYRARNIAAPLNAQRLGVKTPCAIKADKCYDCKSPERICRGLSVLWEKPMTGEFEIILIHENLGY